jgi:aconitase B
LAKLSAVVDSAIAHQTQIDAKLDQHGVEDRTGDEVLQELQRLAQTVSSATTVQQTMADWVNSGQ